MKKIPTRVKHRGKPNSYKSKSPWRKTMRGMFVPMPVVEIGVSR
jgi:hypothetical protein